MKCVCGEQLKYIAGSDGCGDLRCISCTRSSGYCSSVQEAMKQFKRIYKDELEVQGMNELTREQILAMPAGRELDAYIAKYVMFNHSHPLEEVKTWCKHYSSDIWSAWEILNKPEIMDHYQIGVHPTSFGVWVARPFMPGGKDCTVQDESGPLAICKCALLAVMGL